MKTFILRIILFSMLISIISCSKEDNNAPTPEQILKGGQSVKAYKNETGNEKIELQPNAIMIANDINSTLVDVGDTTLKFTNASALDLVKTGDVIYSLPTDKYPDGYAYKILSKENISNQIVCNYEPATMDDVFVKFNEKIDLKPDMSKGGVRVYDIMPRTGNKIKNTNSSIYNVIGFDSEKFTGVNFTLNSAELTYIIYDNDNNYKDTKYDQIKAKLKLTTDYSSVDAVFDEGVFAVFGYPTVGISCELESGGIEADSDLAKKLSDKLKSELVGKKVPLISFDLTQFSLSSLALKPTVEIYMILELSAEGKLKAKFSYSDTRIYFKVQNYETSPTDDKLVCEIQKWGTPDFSIEAKMEASATLGIGVGLKFTLPAFEWKKGEKSYFGIFSDVSYEGQIIAKGGWSLNGGLQCKDYGYSLKPYWKTYGEARLGIFRNKLLSIDIQPNIAKNELSILPSIEKSYNFCEDQPVVPTNGLVAYYPFDGNADDETGNGNNGTVNGASLTTDRNGNANKAYSFDGVDDFIRVENSNTLQNLNNNCTISAWVFANNYSITVAEIIPILAKSASSSSTNQFRLGYDKSSNALYSSINGTGYSANCPTVLLNSWYHIVVVHNGNQTSFFINGIEYNFTNTGNSTFDSSQPLIIGQDIEGLNEKLDGKLDDIRIYNRALTDSEVEKLYKL